MVKHHQAGVINSTSIGCRFTAQSTLKGRKTLRELLPSVQKMHVLITSFVPQTTLLSCKWFVISAGRIGTRGALFQASGSCVRPETLLTELCFVM
jgi:hypothetical protein